MREIFSKTRLFGVVLFLAVLIHNPLLAQEDKTMLAVGTEAPDFKMMGSDGKMYTLAEFRQKKNVVLVFYPGDNTPVCTSQLCALRDDWAIFEKKDAVIFGVNPGNVDSHEKFAAKHDFPFPLLADVDGAVSKLYGCSGWPLIKRTVYVVDKKGTIIFAQRGKPDTGVIADAIQ